MSETLEDIRRKEEEEKFISLYDCLETTVKINEHIIKSSLLSKKYCSCSFANPDDHRKHHIVEAYKLMGKLPEWLISQVEFNLKINYAYDNPGSIVNWREILNLKIIK